MLWILNFILNCKMEKNCPHLNALINSNEGYCPDCGKYLKKYYYVLHCKHCDIKREAKIQWGKIVPESNFCTNCGGKDFYIERFEKINMADFRYAICRKEEVQNKNIKDLTQIWVEEQEIQKLLDVNQEYNFNFKKIIL